MGYRHGTDCSGSSADIRIKAISNMPAQPPPMNATNNHHTEIIALLPSAAFELPICSTRVTHRSPQTQVASHLEL